MKKNWITTTESKISGFAEWIYDHRIKVLFGLALLIFGAATQLPKITFDTSTEGFLYKDDPQIIAYNKFRNQFGRDEKLIIAIKTDDVFDMKFLAKLKAMHEEIENNTPYIKDVSSLINARVTTGDKDTLIVDDLFKNAELPKNKQELKKLKDFAMSNPIYKNLYLSDDGTFTTIVITTNTYTSLNNKSDDSEKIADDEFSDNEFGDEFSEDSSTIEDKNNQKLEFITGEETSKTIQSVEAIMKKYQDNSVTMYIAGSPIVTEYLQKTLMMDMSSFILYVILTISIILFLMYRRVSGIVLPLILVILTLISTVSWMAIWRIPITSMTQILPSLLLAVGVASTVHLLAMFYHKFDETGDKRVSVSYAMGHSGLAIVMTSFTTAASLFSFAFSTIAPVSFLGLFASGGVIFILIMVLVFIPAMLSVSPLKVKQIKAKNENTFVENIMEKIANTAITYPKTILNISIVVIVVSLYLGSFMSFSHNPLHWFEKGNSVRVATEVIDKELRGSITIEVVLDTGVENGVYEPKFLNAIEKSVKQIYTFKDKNYFVGKIVSISDVIKEIHKALNENRDDFYAIPQSYDLVSQEFLLFENSGSDDLEDIVDNRFSKTRISIKAPWVDAVEYVELIESIEKSLNDNIGTMATISVTGTLPILASTITQSIQSSIDSYIFAFGIIAIMMILLIGEVKLGLISMLPNLTPILFGIAVMEVYNVPLDMFTILIGAIAIGLAVDDTIHFMHNFKRYHIMYGNVDKAIKMSLHTTGSAIFVTSVVLSAGFFVFMFASMTNLIGFGFITGVTILVAMFTNLILAPALVKLAVKDRV
jgi:predicted RND superfamily exporter protein